MAINPTTYQMPAAFTPNVDWTQLSNLGNVYSEAKSNALKTSTLAALGNDPATNVGLLIQSGHPELQLLGVRLQNQLRGETREDARNAITDKRADDYLNIAKGADTRAKETHDEDSPTGRIAKLREANQDPKDPRWREYIITGELPKQVKTFAEEVAARKEQAAQLGIKETDPNYLPFVTTGNWPRETQAMSAGEKGMIEDTDNLVRTGEAGLASLNRAKQLSAQAYSSLGPASGPVGYATSFLGKGSDLGKAGIATTNLTNEVLSNALSQLKAIFGAAPTEGERKILLELQGSVNQPDSVRQEIYNRAIEAGRIKVEQMRAKAMALRNQTYFKPGGGDVSTTPPRGAPAAAGGGGAVSDPFDLRR